MASVCAAFSTNRRIASDLHWRRALSALVARRQAAFLRDRRRGRSVPNHLGRCPDTADFRRSQDHAVTGKRNLIEPGRGGFDITPDGKYFVMLLPQSADAGKAPAAQINITLNWFDELKQRVPVQ